MPEPFVTPQRERIFPQITTVLENGSPVVIRPNGTCPTPIPLNSPGTVTTDEDDLPAPRSVNGDGGPTSRAPLLLQLADLRAQIRTVRRGFKILEKEQEKAIRKLEEYKNYRDGIHSRVNELLKCTICEDRLHNPALLTECGHAFCEACLAGHFARIEDRCPTCLSEITTPPVEDFCAHRLLDIFQAAGDPAKRGSSWVGSWDKWFRPKAPADNRKVGIYD